MRSVSLAVAALLIVTSTAAQAALVWSETSTRGVPITTWAMGASSNEASAAAEAMAGQPVSVILSCRQPGYFAYVGAIGQTQRGVSCGYATPQAAVYQARMDCELEGGRCDLEKIGYDSGKALADNAKATGLPVNLPGSTAGSGEVRPPNSPFVE